MTSESSSNLVKNQLREHKIPDWKKLGRDFISAQFRKIKGLLIEDQTKTMELR